MKKKSPVHPKLYQNIIESNNTSVFYYISNLFDDSNKRIVQLEVRNEINFNKKTYLFKENTIQFEILKKYLKIQKKVLEKRKKTGNYDAYKIIKNSINTIIDFKNEFDDWFKENK